MNSREVRRNRVGDIVRILLMLIALGVFCYSGYMLYTFYMEYKRGSDEYDNLESSYASQETEDLEAIEEAFENDEAEAAAQAVEGREVVNVVEKGEQISLPVMNNPIDFGSLEAVNPDIKGWLRLSAVDISYPLVQGEDNDYYLHKTFEGEDNIAGCLFINYENEPDFTDTNTVVYGHNMRNGSMFGKLKQFREDGVFEKSKYFWIFTPDLIYQYRIFSGMEVAKTGLTYQTKFRDDEYRKFLKVAFENSELDNTDVTVTEEDRVVTLSTCTGDTETRFVIIGKLSQVYVSKGHEKKAMKIYKRLEKKRKKELKAQMEPETEPPTEPQPIVYGQEIMLN